MFVSAVVVLHTNGCALTFDRLACCAGQLLLIQGMIDAAVNASEAALLAEGGPVSTQCSVGADAAAANAASMDNAWLVLGGALVFFMHSGFALLEVGSVSQRNVQNILFKNAVSPTFAALLFWMFGYTFAFGGNGEGGFIGSQVRMRAYIARHIHLAGRISAKVTFGGVVLRQLSH